MDYFSDQLSESYANLIEKLGSWVNLLILQLPNILIAVIVALLSYFFTKYVRKIAVKTSGKFTENKTILNLVANVSTVIFGFIVLFVVLSILNLGSSINKILATAGVLGLAIGLALQDPLNNLFSGIFMSVRDLYRIGDLVESNGHFGTIKDIDLRATKLLIPTGQIVVIPNKDVISNPLNNFSESGRRRVDVSCGVSYGDDLEKVEQLVIQTLSKLPSILKETSVDVVFEEFGDSSINFTARFWIEATGQRDYLIEKSNAIKSIKKAFDANDIMIPFPIRTLDFGIRGGVPMSQMLSIESKEIPGK